MCVENFVDGRWNFERTRRDNCPPWGIRGGKPASTGDYLLRLPQENEFHSVGGAHRPVPAHAEVIVRTGGGGGWGDPLERDPERVRADVLEEFVSPEAARARIRRRADAGIWRSTVRPPRRCARGCGTARRR